MKLKNFKNFLGEHPPDPPSYFRWLKAGRGLGTRILANVVCPRCALASAVFWLRHCTQGNVPGDEAKLHLCLELN